LTTVGFLLIVACANLANLLLVRTSVRRHEMAVRSALGARGASLLVPLIAEALILAVLGGAVGLLFAWVGVRAISQANIGNLPRIAEVRLSWEVLTFVTGVTWLTALMLATVAGSQVHRRVLAQSLQDVQRGHTAGRSLTLLRGGLVVAQLAVSVVLLIGGGLLGRSFASLLSQDLGFRRERLLTIDLSSRAEHSSNTITAGVR
jgi:hypothetical protein